MSRIKEPFSDISEDSSFQAAPEMLNVYIPLFLPDDRASDNLPQSIENITLFDPIQDHKMMGKTNVIGLTIKNIKKSQITSLSRSWHTIINLCALGSKTGLSYSKSMPGSYAPEGRFGLQAAAIIPSSMDWHPYHVHAGFHAYTWPDAIAKSLFSIINRLQSGLPVDVEAKSAISLKLYNDSHFENSNEAKFVLLISSIEAITKSLPETKPLI